MLTQDHGNAKESHHIVVQSAPEIRLGIFTALDNMSLSVAKHMMVCAKIVPKGVVLAPSVDVRSVLIHSSKQL